MKYNITAVPTIVVTSKGKEIGRTLEKLLDKVIKNEIKNAKTDLLRFLNKGN